MVKIDLCWVSWERVTYFLVNLYWDNKYSDSKELAQKWAAATHTLKKEKEKMPHQHTTNKNKNRYPSEFLEEGENTQQIFFKKAGALNTHITSKQQKTLLSLTAGVDEERCSPECACLQVEGEVAVQQGVAMLVVQVQVHQQKQEPHPTMHIHQQRCHFLLATLLFLAKCWNEVGC